MGVGGVTARVTGTENRAGIVIATDRAIEIVQGRVIVRDHDRVDGIVGTTIVGLTVITVGAGYEHTSFFFPYVCVCVCVSKIGTSIPLLSFVCRTRLADHPWCVHACRLVASHAGTVLPPSATSFPPATTVRR